MVSKIGELKFFLNKSNFFENLLIIFCFMREKRYKLNILRAVQNGSVEFQVFINLIIISRTGEK